MRSVFVLVLGIFLAACSQFVLPERSTRYTYTFGDLEDRIILENLARFIDDYDRIPSLADFKQGSVQATDNLSLGATIPYTKGLSGINVVKNPQVFNVGAAQIQSQDNWTYVPVTDVEDLGRTRCLYKFAIVQSRNPGTQWNYFSMQCKVGGKSLAFPYSPPPSRWLTWTLAGDQESAQADYILDDAGVRYDFLGTYRSYSLWGKLPEFHDFELAILGSFPNTAGAASTTKVATAPGPALSFLSDNPVPPFTAANQTLKFIYRVKNVGTDTIQQVVVTSSKVQVEGDCASFDLAAGEQRNCNGSYTTTEQDVHNCIDDLSTAVGQNKSNGLISAAIRKKICTNRPPVTTLQEIKPNFIPQQFFVPGKSSGSIVPPMAAPAQ